MARMDKLEELLGKRKEQEEKKINDLKKQITEEISPEIERRVREELEKEYASKTENVNREELEKKIRSEVEEEYREKIKNEVVVLDKEKEQEDKTVQSLLSLNLKTEINKKLEIFDDIQDLETRNFLKVKTTELLVRGFDYTLHVGRIGQEVFEELGRKGSPEGLYTKWVKLNGFSESTIKRYRNKWEVYSSVHDSIKPYILLLSHAQIEKILKEEDIKISIYSANENETYEDIMEILKEGDKKLPEPPKEVEFPSDFNIDNFNNIFNNLDKLSEKKKGKLYKLLEEIAKLIKEQ